MEEKISKKRFIKLAMSKGYQRNIANFIYKMFMNLGYQRTKLNFDLFMCCIMTPSEW